MINSPLVSIIMPVCNVEQYVAEAIESLIKQTFSDIEIICIDDGSTDNSGEILDSYAQKDERIRVIHKPNSGYGNTMNIGIKEAKAEYLAILESDDKASPYMIEKLYEKAIVNKMDIVKGSFYVYYGDENKFYIEDMYHNYPKNEIISIEDDMSIVFMRHCVWTGLYKKSFLLDNDIWFNETPGASYQDVGFLTKCWLNLDRIMLLDDPLVYYRSDNPGSSVKSRKKEFCVCDEHKSIKEYILDHPKTRKRASAFWVGLLCRDYLATYGRINRLSEFAFIRQMYNDLSWLNENGFIKEDSIYFCEDDKRYVAQILEDYEAFYSGRSEKDKLELIDILTDDNFDQLFELKMKNANRIFIYGAGKYGERMRKLLVSYGCDDKIDSFLVTESPSVQEISGIPVKKYSRFIIPSSGDYVLIIAIMDYEVSSCINKKLERDGIYNVIELKPLLRNILVW